MGQQLEEVLLPERDLLLVRREPGNQTDYHGLVIPETARQSDNIAGVILRSGPEAIYEPGTRVVMARGSGTSLMLVSEREELALIQSLDVLAIWPLETEVTA